MKKIILPLILAMTLATIHPVSAAFPVPTTVPTTIPTTTNTSTVPNTQTLTNAATQGAFATTQKAVITSIDGAQKGIDKVNDGIKKAQFLNQSQKDQLLKCTNMATTNLNTYETGVNASTNSTELQKATQDYKARAKANEEQIKACVYAVVAIAIQEMIDANAVYLRTAQEYSDSLVATCKSPVVTVNKSIGIALGLQKNLQDAYNKVFADQKVTSADEAALVTATQVVVSKSFVDQEIYTQLLALSATCGI